MFLSKFCRAAFVPFKSTMKFPMVKTNQFYFSTGVMGDSDIVQEVVKDHRELVDIYMKYKAAPNIEEGRKWFNQFIWEICRHSVAEEIIMYNMMEMVSDKGKELSEKSREDHRKLKVMLEDLRHEKDEAEFDRKFEAAYNEFIEHTKLEEGEDLPFLQENISLEKRQTAARMFALKKNLSPTRPHPEIPDKPTAVEMALGLLVTPIDKIRDIFTEFPDKK